VQFDDVGTLLTIRVQGFKPEFAQALNKEILEESEVFVNGLSRRMAEEQVLFANSELKRASERLQEAKSKVLAFQTQHKLLDPNAQFQAAGTLTSELQGTMARLEAELKSSLSYLQDDSFQLKTLRAQIAAVRSQIEAERVRSTGGPSLDRLNNLTAEFRDLTLQAGFAQDVYKLALTAVEGARVDATRKLKILAVIEPPAQPETAIYPRRLYNLVTLLVICCLLYGITRLVVATVREHQD
jgi:capsular polysaccharide transport system permease protein